MEREKKSRYMPTVFRLGPVGHAISLIYCYTRVNSILGPNEAYNRILIPIKINVRALISEGKYTKKSAKLDKQKYAVTRRQEQIHFEYGTY